MSYQCMNQGVYPVDIYVLPKTHELIEQLIFIRALLFLRNAEFKLTLDLIVRYVILLYPHICMDMYTISG